MKLISFLALALRSLATHKLRSSLTMLGIIIGVGAVITLMSLGRGAQTMITAYFEELGSNVLYTMSRSPEVGGIMGLSPAFVTPTLTLDDARALERLGSVSAVAPISENLAQLAAGDESVIGMIDGTTPEYQEVFNWKVASGQFISQRNVASRDTVVVLGDKIAKSLFSSTSPMGQKVRIKGHRFTVIGVMAPKGGAFMGISTDDVVITPITTFQSKLFTRRTASGEDSVLAIGLKVTNAEAIDEVRAEAEAILRKRHRLSPDEKNDFAFVSQAQVANLLTEVTGIFGILLGAIAGISLLVGGIGIMNIMLVSVTERTREIGIRKAVGAKRRDILLQFLLEAAMLSLSGGSIGIAGGWLLSVLISQIDIGGTTLRAVVSPNIVVLAVSVSVFIGLVSGIYPAMRAARLNPINALRYG